MGHPKLTRRTAKNFQYPHGLQYTNTPINIIILTGEDDYSSDRFPEIQEIHLIIMKLILVGRIS
jgi:hypothetical protein